jgi:FAD/FMN-containing dehydrogenase
LYHVPYNKNTTLLVGYFDSVKKLQEAVVEIAPLNPSAQELVDDKVIEFVMEKQPSVIEGLLPEQMPKVVLLVEFDDEKGKVQAKKSKQAQKILQKFSYEMKVSNNKLEQDKLWKIRRQAAAVIWMQQGPKKALPIIEDGIVPLDKFDEFVEKAYKLLDKYKVKDAVWGHAGNGHLHIQPFLDLSNIRDRHKIYALSDEFYKMVLSLGGSISGEHNDGIMRGSYLRQMYGGEMYDLFKQVKKMFDPYNLLNPRSKLGATKEYGQVHLRKEYSMKHLLEHMPGIGSFH